MSLNNPCPLKIQRKYSGVDARSNLALMDAYEWRCQELRKIIADGVDAIVRIEGRYYTMHEVMRDDGRLYTLWRSVGGFDLKAVNHLPEKKNSNMPC
jgi:hypothetical protein